MRCVTGRAGDNELNDKTIEIHSPGDSVGLGMRIILSGAVLFSASALLGCSSQSTAPWGAATSKSEYLAVKPLVERERPTTPSVGSQTNVEDAVGRKIGDAKIYDVKAKDAAAIDNTLPADDPRKALRELDHRQAEENRKIDAALAICHC
jgi:hypothetical protein